MKKNYLLLCFILCSNYIFPQENDVDNFLNKVKSEINSDKKIDLIVSYFSLPSNESEFVKAQIAQKLLKYSYTNKDKISEALSLNEISYFYMASNKSSEGLAICLKALKIAEKVENEKLIGYINAKLSFFYEDFNTSYSFLKKSLNIANRIKDDNLKLETYKKLSELFLQNNKINQSLQFTQKEYELTLKLKKLQEIGYTYLGFAEIHRSLKNKELALSYYNMAISYSKKVNSKRQLGWSYNFKSSFFLENNELDSAKVYAQKSIATFEKSVEKTGSLPSASILLNMYRKENIDSAFKYSEKLRIGTLSLLTANNPIDNLKLKLDEELRQKSITDKNEKLEEEKKQNLQYIFIAFGILTLIVLILLLSRSFITNTKLIKFFGVIGLLIVFEFLNLLLHPFLEKVTHHSPILMLVALVVIAALLVPLHHKVEHWATTKLIEKNKKIRLANAEKTIEQLNKK